MSDGVVTVLKSGKPECPEPDRYRGSCGACGAMFEVSCREGHQDTLEVPPPTPPYPHPRGGAPVTGHRIEWLNEWSVRDYYRSPPHIFLSFYGCCQECGGRVTYRPEWRNPEYRKPEEQKGFLSWLFGF